MENITNETVKTNIKIVYDKYFYNITGDKENWLKNTKVWSTRFFMEDFWGWTNMIDTYQILKLNTVFYCSESQVTTTKQ